MYQYTDFHCIQCASYKATFKWSVFIIVYLRLCFSSGQHICVLDFTLFLTLTIIEMSGGKWCLCGRQGRWESDLYPEVDGQIWKFNSESVALAINMSLWVNNLVLIFFKFLLFFFFLSLSFSTVKKNSFVGGPF